MTSILLTKFKNMVWFFGLLGYTTFESQVFVLSLIAKTQLQAFAFNLMDQQKNTLYIPLILILGSQVLTKQAYMNAFYFLLKKGCTSRILKLSFLKIGFC